MPVISWDQLVGCVFTPIIPGGKLEDGGEFQCFPMDFTWLLRPWSRKIPPEVQRLLASGRSRTRGILHILHSQCKGEILWLVQRGRICRKVTCLFCPMTVVGKCPKQKHHPTLAGIYIYVYIYICIYNLQQIFVLVMWNNAQKGRFIQPCMKSGFLKETSGDSFAVPCTTSIIRKSSSCWCWKIWTHHSLGWFKHLQETVKSPAKYVRFSNGSFPLNYFRVSSSQITTWPSCKVPCFLAKKKKSPFIVKKQLWLAKSPFLNQPNNPGAHMRSTLAAKESSAGEPDLLEAVNHESICWWPKKAHKHPEYIHFISIYIYTVSLSLVIQTKIRNPNDF